MKSDALPLYVHIPFCLSKCDYCDFFSVPCQKARKEYVRSLQNEIRAISRNKGLWQTVYVGGGTPSLLTADEIRMLFDAIWQASGGVRASEVTFEVNPRDVTEELLETLSSCGVTRISCGFQSFSRAALEGVHRSSTIEDEMKSLDALQKWRGAFSADMIAGLPCETEETLAGGLKTLCEHKANHISLYTLTVEENTPLGRRFERKRAAALEMERADSLYLYGRDALKSMGYEQYEVSSFCKGEERCRHNEAYWQMSDYAGAGSGAVSSFYGVAGESGVRYTNTKDIDKYIKYWLGGGGAANAPREMEVLSAKTQRFEYYMLGLRMTAGVPEEGYKERFGCEMEEATLMLFDAWEKRGLARRYKAGGRTYHAMTEAGLLLLDRFLVEVEV